MSFILSLTEARQIAGTYVTRLSDWNGAEAYCECPGREFHTTADALTDCSVVCEKLPNGCPPGIYCYHASCEAECDEASYHLRSALGKREPAARKSRLAALLPPPKPVFDPVGLARVAAKAPNVNENFIKARSYYPPDALTPAMFLHALYEPGERVLIFDVFESQGQTLWEHPGDDVYAPRELNHYRRGKPVGVWFQCNPVSGLWLPKPSPENPAHKTRRDYRCVTAFKHLLLESDCADPRQWLAALVQLPLPIVSIVTSGVISAHALVRIDAASKAEFDEKRNEIRDQLIILGVDKKAMTAVQLTRLPFCQRLGKNVDLLDADGKKTGQRYEKFPKPRMQKLLYICPNADGTPIMEKAVRYGL